MAFPSPQEQSQADMGLSVVGVNELPGLCRVRDVRHLSYRPLVTLLWDARNSPPERISNGTTSLHSKFKIERPFALASVWRWLDRCSYLGTYELVTVWGLASHHGMAAK